MTSLADLEAKYFPASIAAPQHSEDTVLTPRIDGTAYFAAAQSAIDAAGSGDEILLVAWTMVVGMPLVTGGLDFAQTLVDKAAAGVDVKVILWINPKLLWEIHIPICPPLPEPYWTVEADEYLRELTRRNFAVATWLRGTSATGAPAGAAPPLANSVLLDWSGLVNGSQHQKALLVRTGGTMRALLGGVDPWPLPFDVPGHPPRSDGYSSWHDGGVQLDGGAAVGVYENFAFRWNEAGSLPGDPSFELDGATDKLNPGSYGSMAVTVGINPGSATSGSYGPAGYSSRVLQSFGPAKVSRFRLFDTPWSALPAGGRQDVLAVYQQAIAAADTYIYIEDQTLNTEPKDPVLHDDYHMLLFPLLKAAAARGVKVVLVTSSGSGGLNPEAHLYFSPEGPTDPINVGINEIEGVKVHMKLMMVDDEFLAIGSANFFDRGMDGTDTELQLAAVSTDGAMIRDLRIQLWAEHLRTDPAPIQAALEDLDQSLPIWNPAWRSDPNMWSADGNPPGFAPTAQVIVFAGPS